MRKFILLICCLFGVMLVSCETATIEPTTEVVPPINSYDITFENNGHGQKVEKITVTNTLPTLPVLNEEGYNFIGWFFDSELTKPYDSSKEIKENITLYAKWEKVTYNFNDFDSNTKKLLNAGGFLDDKISDFVEYENTDKYRVVKTVEEFVDAILAAKYTYTNNFDEATNTVTQTLEKEGSVRVIEIANDLNLGYNVISDVAKSKGIVVDYKTSGAMSKMVKENGISQVKIEGISNLLIYSKTGCKITHAGFKLTSCHNVVFRNLKMDELWEWEDSSDKTSEGIGNYDKFGWAYFKISHCGQIWIDHMEFGKSFDGLIDYSNPVSNSKSTKMRLAYGSDGSNGLHISYCKFAGGNDDKEGYIYKMMDDIEKEYQEGKANYLYYNALRDSGLSFEEILYGLAIPQKKGFLCGDNAEAKDDFYYNSKMLISFNSCKFINLCDRIPKIRGGQCYFYNSVIDCTEYLKYRDIVKSKGNSGVAKVNSTWKVAGVSALGLVSYGGYLHFENVIIKGVSETIKNNDSKANPFVENKGYFNFINCSYQLNEESTYYEGSTNDYEIPSPFNKGYGNLNIPNQLWPYFDGVNPLDEKMVRLPNLLEHVDNEIYGCGTKLDVVSWLKCNLV